MGIKKKPAGRPRTGQGISQTLYLPAAVWAQITQIALREDRPRNAVARRLLESALKSREGK